MGAPGITKDSLSDPTSLRPLLATPRKRYSPLGKRFLNVPNGTFFKGGSLASRNSSLSPNWRRSRPVAKVPFGTFKKRFPKGEYRFRGVASNGRRLVGSDMLSFVIPGAPMVTFPTKGALVDPDGFKVTWEPVTTPADVKIATYQVIVNQGDRELSMYLPPSATSATIPGEFLESDTETGGEVLAREKSGNQTITALPSFRTK